MYCQALSVFVRTCLAEVIGGGLHVSKTYGIVGMRNYIPCLHALRSRNIGKPIPSSWRSSQLRSENMG